LELFLFFLPIIIYYYTEESSLRRGDLIFSLFLLSSPPREPAQGR
jgi:hypothetical protein